MNPSSLQLLSTPRTPHLKRIWADLAKESSLPQLDRWLVARLKQEKKFGSKDRRFYSDSLFAMMRRAMALPELSAAEPDQAWAILRSFDSHELFEKLDSLDLDALDSDERRAGLNAWFAPKLVARAEASSWSDEQKARFLKAQSERAPFWLRLNHLDKKAKVEAILNEMDVPFEGHGHAIKILQEKNLSGSKILDEGWAEVQDYGSQLLGLSIPLQAGAHLWDACAGGGGKSLQLASLHPKAQIWSSDVRSYKSAEVNKRAQRARLPNISTLDWDGSKHFNRPMKLKNGFDSILVDAPCSGSGTWRRSPEGRFKVSTTLLQELQDLQFSIVEKVLPHLKPGAELIYATCSWFVEENEAVVERIQKNLGLTLIEQSLKGLPDADSDTLFIARLAKPS